MEIKFRMASEEDLEKIINLCNECFEESTSLDYAKNIFQENKVDKNTIQIVAILDNEVIAYVRLAIINTMFEDMGKYAIINHFCVKPEHRRKNIATRMLEGIDKLCAYNGIKSVKLWSKNFRVPAHKCYEKHSFNKIDAAFFEKKVGE